jgi:23S rRNA pseudouridine1911/1915/1917 synthase
MRNLMIVKEEYTGGRLDALLGQERPEQSRAYWQKAIEAGYVTVNGKPATKKYHVVAGDKVRVVVPALPPTHYPLPIIFENEDVIAFDKPAGLLTHSKGAFNPEFTVADYMKRFYPTDQSGRAGIVHRLDRDTSGVIIAAKNEAARSFLQKQFSDRKVKKVYIAAVDVIPKPEEALLDWPIERNPKKPQTFRVGANGKTAQTHYKILCSHNTQSLLQLEPRTGRTHQLRVHLAHLKTPIMGDRLYNPSWQKGTRLMLHAYELSLNLPGSNQISTFQAPIPAEFRRICHV